MSYKPDNSDWKNGAEWGVKQGEAHAKSSPETRQTLKNMGGEINNIKINMAELNKDMKYLKSTLEQHIADQKEDFNKIVSGQNESIDKIEAMFSDAMKKKADKEIVDKIQSDIRWAVYTVVGCVIVGIIGFVFFGK